MPIEYVKCMDLRFVQQLEGAIPDIGSCTPQWESGDVYGATVTVTMELTPQQITEVFSALMTGADILYPEKNHEVLWYFWGALECPP